MGVQALTSGRARHSILLEQDAYGFLAVVVWIEPREPWDRSPPNPLITGPSEYLMREYSLLQDMTGS